MLSLLGDQRSSVCIRGGASLFGLGPGIWRCILRGLWSDRIDSCTSIVGLIVAREGQMGDAIWELDFLGYCPCTHTSAEGCGVWFLLGSEQCKRMRGISSP